MCHLDLNGWTLADALAVVQRDCPGLTVEVTGCDPLKSYGPENAVRRVVRARRDADRLELTVSVFKEYAHHERHTEDR